MAIVTCPKCSYPSSGETFCPHCGTDLSMLLSSGYPAPRPMAPPAGYRPPEPEVSLPDIIGDDPEPPSPSYPTPTPASSFPAPPPGAGAGAESPRYTAPGGSVASWSPPGQTPPPQAPYGGPSYGPGGYRPQPMPGYGQYGYGQYGYTTAAVPQTNTLAVLSLIFAIVCLAPVGVILGVIAMSQIKKTGQRGSGLAIAGIAIGSVVTLFWIIGATV